MQLGAGIHTCWKHIVLRGREQASMYNVVVCDDSREDRGRICSFVEQAFSELNEKFTITTFESAEAFLAETRPYMFDIAIFDVEMKDINGVEGARRLRIHDESVQIIFLTSHSEYVFASFSAEPLNYLLKPVKYAVLKQQLERAVRKIDTSKEQAFSFEVRGAIQRVPINQIHYFESQVRVVHLVSTEGERTFYDKLDNVAEDRRLKDFIRCHKSYLVNPAFISSVSNGRMLLTTDEELPISRSKFKEVKSAVMDYLLGTSL